MKTEFTINLTAVRANTGMSQTQWANALGFSPKTIFKWENGESEPTASALRKMSELSGIPMDYIFVPEKSEKIGIEDESD